MKIMNILRTQSLGSNFIGSNKRKCTGDKINEVLFALGQLSDQKCGNCYAETALWFKLFNYLFF